MDIQIQAVHFNATSKLKDFIQNRLKRLEKLNDKIVSVNVFLQLEPNTVENKICEIKLDVPGHNLFAKKNSKSFEESVDNTVDALKHQLKKIKTQQQNHK